MTMLRWGVNKRSTGDSYSTLVVQIITGLNEGHSVLRGGAKSSGTGKQPKPAVLLLPLQLARLNSPVAARINIIIGGEALAKTLARIAHPPVGAFCILLGALDRAISV